MELSRKQPQIGKMLNHQRQDAQLPNGGGEPARLKEAFRRVKTAETRSLARNVSPPPEVVSRNVQQAWECVAFPHYVQLQ